MTAKGHRWGSLTAVQTLSLDTQHRLCGHLTALHGVSAEARPWGPDLCSLSTASTENKCNSEATSTVSALMWRDDADGQAADSSLLTTAHTDSHFFPSTLHSDYTQY